MVDVKLYPSCSNPPIGICPAADNQRVLLPASQRAFSKLALNFICSSFLVARIA